MPIPHTCPRQPARPHPENTCIAALATTDNQR